MMLEGQAAPTFRLPDQDGKMHGIGDYAESWLVLYFYPKDMTPGCTQEACDFRDNFARIQSAGAVVVGVSADPVKRHKKFAQKEGIPFTLLADEDHAVCNAYDVWHEKKFMGRTFMGIVRSTFIIDPKGLVQKVYSPVSVPGHVDEVITDLDRLRT